MDFWRFMAVAGLIWLFMRVVLNSVMLIETRKVRRQTAKTLHYLETHEDDSPDGPPNLPDGYPTWEAAMNRPITDELRFRIQYADVNGEITEREITPKMIRLERVSVVGRIEAFCHMCEEDRTFRNERIIEVKNVKTGRKIDDLGAYLRSRY